MYDPRLDQLARVLVRYSTEVKKGDTVRVRMPAVRSRWPWLCIRKSFAPVGIR